MRKTAERSIRGWSTLHLAKKAKKAEKVKGRET